MAVNTDYTGRTFPVGEPYEVTRVKIAEFAEAIGDANPVYVDAAAAKAAGYPDVIAPPTFPIAITLAANRVAITDPGFGLNYTMVVHGEQRFTYTRPLRAGDVVTAQTTIAAIKQAGSLTLVTLETAIADADGEHVCTGMTTLVERGAA